MCHSQQHFRLRRLTFVKLVLTCKLRFERYFHLCVFENFVSLGFRI
eukprot:UN14219